MKRRIRLTEGDLRRIVKESINKIIQETKLRHVTLRYLKSLVRSGNAIDISTAEERPEPLEQIGYSAGVYGCMGFGSEGKKLDNTMSSSGEYQTFGGLVTK